MDHTRNKRLNTSAGVASIAVALILVATKGWAWAETGSKVVVAILLRGARQIGGDAFAALMDHGAPTEVEHKIAAVVAEFSEILGFHDLKTRVSGAHTFAQLHIELDGELTLFDAQAIGARLRLRILEAVPGSEVPIHLDPEGDGGTPQ